MRGLVRHWLVCLGALGLLLCWLAELLLVGALFIRGGLLGDGLGGFLLFFVFLYAGALALPVFRDRRAGAVFALTAGAAMFVGGCTAYAAGPQLYHAYAGAETTGAVIAETRITRRQYGETGTHYRLRDLGWLERGPWQAAEAGDRIEVSIDPHGWAQPVATERLTWTWTTLPAALLIACFAAVALAAARGVALSRRP